MQIVDAFGCAYEDSEGEVIDLRVKLEAGEQLAVGDEMEIPLMDGSVVRRKIMVIEPKCAGDYAPVSRKAAKRVGAGEWGVTKAPVLFAQGPQCGCIAVVADMSGLEVLTDRNVRALQFLEERRKMVCLTPFVELRLGDEKIHEWVEEGYSVPEKVIDYLKTTEPDIMSPGVYEHPFKAGVRLLGPYCYTDGHYWWDRDAWKYVVKYHVKLPREFVDYVMSGKGDEFLSERIPTNSSWFDRLEDSCRDVPHANFLPEDAGNLDLAVF